MHVIVKLGEFELDSSQFDGFFRGRTLSEPQSAGLASVQFGRPSRAPDVANISPSWYSLLISAWRSISMYCSGVR